MKNQIIILLILFLIPIIGFSQKKISIGVNLNSMVSIMSIEAPSSLSWFEEKGGFELGHSISIQLQYELNERFFLRSGLGYQESKSIHRITGRRISYDVVLGFYSIIRNTIKISSIGVPLDFGYVLKSKKANLKYLIGFGGIININQKIKTQAISLDEPVTHLDLEQAKNEVEESLYSLNLFGGGEYKMNKKLFFGIEYNIRFTPNKFKLYLSNSYAKTALETGLIIRVRM